MANAVRVRVSKRGQVEIPQELRDSLGISPGDVVELRPLRDGLLVSKPSNGVPVSAEDVLRYLVSAAGPQAEERGILEEGDLDAAVHRAQGQVHRERYGA